MTERDALARIIWHTSRADEGTISATGANIIADTLLAVGYVPASRLAAVEALDIGHSAPCTHPDEPCICSVPLFDLRAALAGLR